MTSATKDKELYTDKAPGLTFEAFDEKVQEEVRGFLCGSTVEE